MRVNQDYLDDEPYRWLSQESQTPTVPANQEQARANVVNEIITAEREFVKHLCDVVEVRTGIELAVFLYLLSDT